MTVVEAKAAVGGGVRAFDHPAFPALLGFVAGFVDIFGFLGLLGLLPAHVTGNLIFLAVDISRGHSHVVMKIAALPIFALSVAAAAWLIGTLRTRGRDPFPPMILLQAAALALCIPAGLVLPAPASPDGPTVVVIGGLMLFAMATQNTVMRLILNDLPPTTIMTGNITHTVADAVRRAARFGSAMTPAEIAALSRRARRVALALLSFVGGAIAGALAEAHLGPVGLLVPIGALLALLPIARAEART